LVVKIKLYLGVAILIMVSLMFVSCDIYWPAVISGGCRYVDIPGTARITSTETVDQKIEKYTVGVTFDFVPDNPAAIDNYRYPNCKDTGQQLRISARWAQEHRLKEGSELSCVRSEITHGTCTPVNFRFTDYD
jgi:hypothetical protein